MTDLHLNKEKGSQLKLFTPGPVFVPERIRAELNKPNDTHRSQPYEEMHKKATEKLQELLFTDNECFIFTSSATGIMEACMRNLLKDEEKGLVYSAGAFGDRWYDIGLANGKDVHKESIEWGKAVKPEIVKEALSKENYSAVFLQSNETSTGLYNPLDDLIPIIKESGALVCVDATSSMAGIKLEVDKLGIDVCLASVQKCFALPPGLAVASISDQALEQSETVENRGYYFDFQNMLKKNKKHQTPTTPPIPQIRALLAQLEYIIEEEPDVVINVLDASVLERNLYLTTQLIDMDKRCPVSAADPAARGAVREDRGADGAPHPRGGLPPRRRVPPAGPLSGDGRGGAGGV